MSMASAVTSAPESLAAVMFADAPVFAATTNMVTVILAYVGVLIGTENVAM